MEQNTDGAAVWVTPEPAVWPRVMQSTDATLITVHGGQTTTGPVTIVHAPGVTPPATVAHHCGPDCGRP